jgi:hypothetical protein
LAIYSQKKKKRAAARLLGASRQQTEKKGKRKNLEEVEAEMRWGNNNNVGNAHAPTPF